MHRLTRKIRFDIAPFAVAAIGSNSYYAKPTSNSLAIHFILWVELESRADKDTGFVVNVAEIDGAVRDTAVEIFTKKINDNFSKNLLVTFEELLAVLNQLREQIKDKFLPAQISTLAVELGGNRKIIIKKEDFEMLYFSEKFEFAASHKLWNDKFDDEKNYATFGKCANPAGHGHNYIIEVAVKKTAKDLPIAANVFEKIVDENFVSVVDHKNLNADIEYFQDTVATVENIAEFAYGCLVDKFNGLKLDSVTVWENDRTFCRYSS